jgi:protein-tyrosine phosphatase
MAAAYLRHQLAKHNVRGVDVRAAGVSTIVGLLASAETQQVLKSEDLDASRHRSNQMTSDLLRRAKLVLGMTPFHVQSALRLNESVRGRVHLLKEFTKSDLRNVQISDPMGGTLEIYRKCFSEIKAAVDRLILMPEVIGKTIRAEPEKRAATPRARARVKSNSRSTTKAASRAPASSRSRSGTRSGAKGTKASGRTASKRAKPSPRAKPSTRKVKGTTRRKTTRAKVRPSAKRRRSKAPAKAGRR